MTSYTGIATITITRTVDVDHPSMVSTYLRDMIGEYTDDLREISERFVVDVRTVHTPGGEGAISDDLRNANLREWLESEAEMMASARQAILMDDPATREAELCTIARTELFRPMAELTKRVRMRAHAVPHSAACSAPRTGHSIVWSTVPSFGSGSFGAREMTALDVVTKAAESIAKHRWMTVPGVADQIRVEPRYHLGLCGTCSGAAGEHSVLVTIPWAGRELSREYVL